MKKLLIALGVSAAMVSGSALAAGEVSLTAPTRFVKTITENINVSTCVPDFESNGLGTLAEELNLSGGAGQEQFALNSTKVGSHKKEFSLAFNKCPDATSLTGKSKLSVHIDKNNPFVALENAEKGLTGNELNNMYGHGGAQNVYVRLFNAESADNPLQFGENNTIEKDLPNYSSNPEGRIEFKFAAQLYAPKGNATPGPVKAQAPFVVQYK